MTAQSPVDARRVPARRVCAWCRGPIRRASGRGALTCSKSCRQAKSRFRVAAAGATATASMRFAYADPPYPGLARKYYGTAEVNHEILIGTLERDYPDGWALSTSAAALPSVLAMCRVPVRVAAWVRGSRPCVTWRARSAWEPVIVAGGRPRRLDASEVLDDTLLCSINGRQRSHPGALVGMKPAAFCEWVFRLLGALVGDELDDIFPGSGAIGRAWELYAATAGARDTGQLELSPRGSRDTSPPGADDTSCLAGAERRLREQLAATRRESTPDGSADGPIFTEVNHGR